MIKPQLQTSREDRRRSSSGSDVDDLPHLASASFDAVVDHKEADAEFSIENVGTSGSEIEELQARLDIAQLQLYAARDAVKGAEAERATVLGHVKDVEFKLHLAEAEVESLKQELAVERVERASVRKMLARRARDLVRQSLTRSRPSGA